MFKKSEIETINTELFGEELSLLLLVGVELLKGEKADTYYAYDSDTHESIVEKAIEEFLGTPAFYDSKKEISLQYSDDYTALLFGNPKDDIVYLVSTKPLD